MWRPGVPHSCLMGAMSPDIAQPKKLRGRAAACHIAKDMPK
jgi:hypothetical protein